MMVLDYTEFWIKGNGEKCLLKFLHRKLVEVSGSLISDNQIIFVLDMLLTNNVIMTFQTLHYKDKRADKKGFYALKLDMMKVYDRVEWDFVKAVLDHLDFRSRFVALVMSCITSVSCSVLLNGSALSIIFPQWDLREGDHLPPYLFVLCTEIFSFLINKARGKGILSGGRIVVSTPTITHLFFTDDSLFFGTVSKFESKKICDILYM